MPNPQQPELRRSERVPALTPDATEAKRSADRHPDVSTPGSTLGTPVPEDQRPGHHPENEQDQPDPDAMAARLGIRGDVAPDPEDDGGRPLWHHVAAVALGFTALALVRRTLRRR